MPEHWTYGTSLRAARERKGLSQDDAARRVGVKVGAWGAWERGQQVPAMERLAKVVEVLEVEPSEVGYDPPRNMLLVGSDWARQQFDQQAAMIAALEEKVDRLIAFHKSGGDDRKLG